TAAEATADAALTAHNSDTTGVHGITDTSLLVTTTSHSTLDHSTALGTATLSDLSDVAATAAEEDQVLTWSGTDWTPTDLPTSITDHGDLSGLADDDHPQYLKKAGDTMSGALVLAADPLVNLQAATKHYVYTIALHNAHPAQTAAEATADAALTTHTA